VINYELSKLAGEIVLHRAGSAITTESSSNQLFYFVAIDADCMISPSLRHGGTDHPPADSSTLIRPLFRKCKRFAKLIFRYAQTKTQA
jgi:hypothetical protein